MDMSKIVEGWAPSADAPTASLFCDGAKPINLSLIYVEAQSRGSKTLIMQARTFSGEELWAIRMLPSGRLLIGLGTAGSRETEFCYYPEANIGISYNPGTGRLAVAATSPGEPSESFVATAHNAWAPGPPRNYEIMIGAPENYADKAPLGWWISASFRYGEDMPLLGGGALTPVEHDEEGPEEESLWSWVEQMHWEAMTAIVGAGAPDEPVEAEDAKWIAEQAGHLISAHIAWCKENKQ